MKLSQLFSIYPQYLAGDHITSQVKSIEFDSRKVRSGSVFVAVRGQNMDGHNFIDTAIENGAIALVVEEGYLLPEKYSGAVVRVFDTRKALAELAAHFFRGPAEHLFCAGVTGTNGKTSTCYLIEQIFKKFGWPTGVIGTVDHHLGDKVWSTPLTTPDPVGLNQRLSDFYQSGARAAAFEVSSIALDQKRIDYIPFDALVFTNLTRDHLDYHKDVENYFLAKQRFFSEVPNLYSGKETYAIINRDDPYGRRLHVSDKVRRLSYGQRDSCDIQFTVQSQSYEGIRFSVNSPVGEGKGELPLVGEHNLYNAMAALGVAIGAGVSMPTIIEALAAAQGVPGRLEKVVVSKGPHVFIDYAHTPAALESVLTSLLNVRKAMKKNSQVFCVFGCGGDRDQGKRPLMGEIAARLSDHIIVTSDNPRSESPDKIIREILNGVPREFNGKVTCEVDRRKAIQLALQKSNPEDVVLVAGKGHEAYQIIGDEKLSFEDKQVVRELTS